MSKTQVFVSFDLENDGELYERLREDSRTSNSSFTVSSGSRRSPVLDACSESARRRIREADQMIVICGEHTKTSMRVGAELLAARQENTPYFLLWGRREAMCTKPIGARSDDGMYSWTKRIVEDRIAAILRKARADAAASTLRRATSKRT
jgi:hypothetical protein